MNEPAPDPSIEDEPHLQGGGFTPDPREAKSEERVCNSDQSADDQVEQTVWDEPGLSPELVQAIPPDALTYAAWLKKRVAQTNAGTSWSMTFAVALAAGPWAILGAILGDVTGGGQTMFGIAMITLIGPVTEEMVKVAAALWVVEKKPFLFRSRMQIVFCALTGGLVFASVENFLYLQVYISDPSPELIRWRWTVCVALHMGCSLVAGLGLMRIWSQTISTFSIPKLSLATAYLITAMMIHGVYNGFAVLLMLMEFQF